jgi:hypothetical protein
MNPHAKRPLRRESVELSPVDNHSAATQYLPGVVPSACLNMLTKALGLS